MAVILKLDEPSYRRKIASSIEMIKGVITTSDEIIRQTNDNDNSHAFDKLNRLAYIGTLAIMEKQREKMFHNDSITIGGEEVSFRECNSLTKFNLKDI